MFSTEKGDAHGGTVTLSTWQPTDSTASAGAAVGSSDSDAFDTASGDTGFDGEIGEGAGLGVVAGSEAVGEREETPRTAKLPAGLTIRMMEDQDRVRVAELFNEPPEVIRDDYMVSLLADYHGRIVAVLRGWLGHPRGHIEMFHVEHG